MNAPRPECKVLHGDAIQLAPTLPPADLIYLDPPFFSGRKRTLRPGGPEYDDRWPGGMAEYLHFLRGLLQAAVGVLRPHGVIALHLDWRASHWGRLELERLLGPEGFVNEVIWSYRTGGLGKRWLGRKHDTIQVFAKGAKYTFNALKEKSRLAHHYGFKNVVIERDELGPYTYAGLRDVWEIPALRGNQKESVGYPTQKPLALLDRLVQVFSNPGDVVCDLCCGSGTALVAAVLAGRSAVGVDVSEAAVSLARGRLSHAGAGDIL